DSTATINYVLYLDSKDGKELEKKEGFSFVVGAEEVIEGLELAVKEMKKGEKCLITVQPKYAYGDAGDESKGVTPGSKLVYELELVDFTKEKQSWELNTEEKFAACEKAKTEGNELFKVTPIPNSCINKHVASLF